MDAAKVLANVDRALEPLDRMAASSGPVHASQLATVKAAFRQALVIVLNGDDSDPPGAAKDIANPEGDDDDDDPNPNRGRFG